MDARRIVGWNVRRIRVQRGLTIEDLADEARVDESYTARIERAKVNPTLDVLERIAKALGEPLWHLFVEPTPGSRPPRPLKAGRRSR